MPSRALLRPSLEPSSTPSVVSVHSSLHRVSASSRFFLVSGVHGVPLLFRMALISEKNVDYMTEAHPKCGALLEETRAPMNSSEQSLPVPRPSLAWRFTSTSISSAVQMTPLCVTCDAEPLIRKKREGRPGNEPNLSYTQGLRASAKHDGI
ncbi:hypothetical protein KC333_g46 [Hortaea werneckii]|nr:hypothetical protein KC333_g46 [Hortaea werneckii]